LDGKTAGHIADAVNYVGRHLPSLFDDCVKVGKCAAAHTERIDLGVPAVVLVVGVSVEVAAKKWNENAEG